MTSTERILLAALDSSSGALRSCRRLATCEQREAERGKLETEVAQLELDVARCRMDLLLFHQLEAERQAA